jgi:enoyl-CoA hydratase/carnithine racemase
LTARGLPLRDTVIAVSLTNAPTSEPLVTVDRRGPVAWLTLCRPDAANALSRLLVAEFVEAITLIGADARGGGPVRAVVITGAGKSFSAGADLKERRTMTEGETRTFLAELNDALTALAALPCPVIAAMNGAAFGGGLELALACDIRVAAAGAVMGLIEARLGIIPGAGGTQRLTRIVGLARAKEMILTGRRLDAAAACEFGLVSVVVAPEQLEATVLRLVDDIVACGPLAVAQAKAAIDGGMGLPLRDGLAFERRCYEVVLRSADRDEGLRAFSEKRPPAFQGK